MIWSSNTCNETLVTDKLTTSAIASGSAACMRRQASRSLGESEATRWISEPAKILCCGLDGHQNFYEGGDISKVHHVGLVDICFI